MVSGICVIVEAQGRGNYGYELPRPRAGTFLISLGNMTRFVLRDYANLYTIIVVCYITFFITKYYILIISRIIKNICSVYGDTITSFQRDPRGQIL